jgi:HIV Tat-specific factor 1
VASSSKTYAKPPKAPRPITTVYVTNLPPGTTVELLASTFSRAGLLMTDDDGNPKVKLYTDAQGNFKGDALVSYFKQNSVDLACTLFDDTELVLGSGEGNIKVTQAEFKKPSREEEKVKEKNEAAAEEKDVKDLGVGVGQQKAKGKKKVPKNLTEEQRRAAKRIRSLQR